MNFRDIRPFKLWIPVHTVGPKVFGSVLAMIRARHERHFPSRSGTEDGCFAIFFHDLSILTIYGNLDEPYSRVG
jgi:hypothetical protein